MRQNPLKWFIVVSVISAAVILILTVKPETFERLKEIEPKFIGLCFLVVIGKIIADTFKTDAVCRAFGKPIGLRLSLQFILIGYFLALLPTGMFGIPAQVYILNKKGYEVGEGGAVVAVRAITAFVSLFAILFAIGFGGIGETALKSALLRYVAIVVSIIVIFGALFIFAPTFSKKMTNKIVQKLEKKGWKKFVKFLKRFSEEVEKFSYGLKFCLRKGPLWLLLSIVWGMIYFFFHGLIAYFLFRGLSMHPPFFTAIGTQLSLYFLLMFAPTPGASGFAEAAAYFLFKGICEYKELMGIFVIGWRFFNRYLPVIISIPVAVKFASGKWELEKK